MKNSKRENNCIRVVQGLCLAFIILIQYTTSYVSAPTETDYISDSFMFMTVMLSLILIVLEFCKEIKYSVEEVYDDEDYDDDYDDVDFDFDVDVYADNGVANADYYDDDGLEREVLEKDHLDREPLEEEKRPETLGDLDCFKKIKTQKS
tara:strand:- start:419 stop:865 length:447 start_codon:yes stop_codon:yes gene_type:complete